MTAGLRVTEQELRGLLVDRLEVINNGEFDKARTMAARLGVPLEQALVERGRIPLGFLYSQVAQAWGVGFKELKPADIDPVALRLVSEEYARKRALAAFAIVDGRLHVAMCDPRDARVVDEIERLTNRKVTAWLASDGAIHRAHLLYRGDLRALLERSVTEQAARLGGDRDATAGEVVDRMLEYAVVTGASDIHVEPYELEALIRCRVDGVLQEVLSVPAAMLPALVTRLKILGGMRIDERRAPQDGRFTADLGGFVIDLRVSSLPTHWGEKVVLRVLTRETILHDLETLGLVAHDYDKLLRNISRPFGMVLVTGPTGSGKSTTLYAALTRLGTERQNVVNISTIEDPVEYTLPRVSQVAVNPAAGLEFANGLRALLRQDPDIIMVGEIRDRDTADVAVRAALVGRLLLSTLHTNDSTGAVPRLLDMGIEPFLLASTLALVVAQRLVRRICASCRESVPADPTGLAALRARPDFEHTVAVLRAEGVLGASADPLAGVRLFRGAGCVQCGGTGFRGRLGVFELFEVDEAIRPLIMDRRSAAELRTVAIERGMKTMLQDGLAKVWLGETTLDEVFRVAL